MDQVFTDHDKDVIEMKMKAERMWSSCPSKRERRSLACREIPGYSFFGDNIGNRINYIRIQLIDLITVVAFIKAVLTILFHRASLLLYF